MASITNSERLQTAREVGRRYGVSDVTVRRWAQSGKLSAVRLSPRCVRFDPAVVEAFIVAQQANGTPVRVEGRA